MLRPLPITQPRRSTTPASIRCLALDQATEAVASRVTPAVVNIAVTSHAHEQAAEAQGEGEGEGDNPSPSSSDRVRPGFGHGRVPGRPGPRQIEHGIGSGVIISPDGYIVTNNHVVDGAMEVRVTLHDRRSFPGQGNWHRQTYRSGRGQDRRQRSADIAWGDSTKLVPGQSVLAIGSPFGYFRFRSPAAS
jgi:serine protease Do